MSNMVYDALFAGLRDRPEPLMTLADGGQVSKAAFHDMLARAANALLAKGVGKGDRVAVQIDRKSTRLNSSHG